LLLVQIRLFRANLVCSSLAAFCPSFVLIMAFWMWMMPTLFEAGLWARPSVTADSAKADNTM